MSSAKRKRPALKQGDRVVLLENTTDQILNVTYFGKLAEIISETNEDDKSEFFTIQIMDASRKKLEWRKDCVQLLEEVERHNAKVAAQATLRATRHWRVDIEHYNTKVAAQAKQEEPDSNDDQAGASDAHLIILNEGDAVKANRTLSRSVYTLKSLHIQFLCSDIPYDCAVLLGGAVKTLQALEKLTLSGPSSQLAQPPLLDDSDPQDKCFCVISGTLRHLDASNMAPGTFVSCQCPRLETFISRLEVSNDRSGRQHKSNGSLPRLSRQQFDALQNMSTSQMAGTGGSITLEDGMKTLKVRADLVPFIGMNIPDHCWCKVVQFREIQRWETYTSLAAFVQAAQGQCKLI